MGAVQQQKKITAKSEFLPEAQRNGWVTDEPARLVINRDA
jgi:hypothetical protein